MELSPPIDWILAGPPWAQLIALRDLRNADYTGAYESMLAHPNITGLMDELGAWPGKPLKRHNDASHLLHKLAALAEFGLRRDHPRIAPVVDFILANPSGEGAFQTNLHIHSRYGGDNSDRLSWVLCDAPTILYAILRLGVPPDTPAVSRAINHLLSLARENGWPCACSADYKGFRGPGRKADPCPYANLIALKALALVPTTHQSDAVHASLEMLLWHWEIQKERKLYLFGIGTDFRKPKYPLIWYDILHMTDVLSRYPQIHEDTRFQAMITELRQQAGPDGRFTARSMYRAWKGWDFADKKHPSPTITATAWRTLGRVGSAKQFTRFV